MNYIYPLAALEGTYSNSASAVSDSDLPCNYRVCVITVVFKVSLVQLDFML